MDAVGVGAFFLGSVITGFCIGAGVGIFLFTLPDKRVEDCKTKGCSNIHQNTSYGHCNSCINDMILNVDT